MVRALIAIAAWACASAHAFDLQGHRGARGLAPENTMAAFERALALGVTTIETDLAVTKDGVLVISHDSVLNPDLVRGADGQWLAAKGPPIHSLTLRELRTYDIGRTNPASAYAKQFPEQVASDGQRFAALADVFALGKGNDVRFDIETKITPTSGDTTPDPATFAKLVVEAIRQAGMTERTTVQSFDWRTLVEVKKLAPEIRTACLTQSTANLDNARNAAWTAGLDIASYDGSVPKLVRAAGCSTWSSFYRNLTPALVGEAHAAGLTVLAWTVNDPADMARLIDWKVDGLITDYPDRARKVMADKGVALPPARR